MATHREPSAIRQLVRGTFGTYRITRGKEYDSVIANSFGTSTGPGSVNEDILFIAEWSSALNNSPLIVDETLTRCASRIGVAPAYVVYGPVSTATGGGVGTYGTLSSANAFMKANGLSRPLLVGQAYHIGRIALQARSRRLGMNPVVGRNMPRGFDPESSQPWTRNRSAWAAHEFAGAVLLKIKGQL